MMCHTRLSFAMLTILAAVSFLLYNNFNFKYQLVSNNLRCDSFLDFLRRADLFSDLFLIDRTFLAAIHSGEDNFQPCDNFASTPVWFGLLNSTSLSRFRSQFTRVPLIWANDGYFILQSGQIRIGVATVENFRKYWKIAKTPADPARVILPLNLTKFSFNSDTKTNLNVPADVKVFLWQLERSERLDLNQTAVELVLKYWMTQNRSSTLVTNVSTTVPSSKSTNYITCGWAYPDRYGLGNHMFQYASLLGLAKQLHFEPVIIASEHDPLEDAFHLKIRKLNKTSVMWRDFEENCYDCYTPKRYLNLHRNTSWRLTGYLQSYRYFKDIRSEVVSHFAFKSETVAEATKRREIILDQFCPNKTVSNCMLIGVHIRRGDYLNPRMINSGYLVADESYIQRAVQWYQQHFVNFTRVFVVLGNDFHWNNNTFNRLKVSNVVYVVLNPTTAGGDLCLLSMTNHSIVTVGTYGFWAAYLTGGNVTYLKEFTRKGTRLAADMRDTFWPPEWIGL